MLCPKPALVEESGGLVEVLRQDKAQAAGSVCGVKSLALVGALAPALKGVKCLYTAVFLS